VLKSIDMRMVKPSVFASRYGSDGVLLHDRFPQARPAAISRSMVANLDEVAPRAWPAKEFRLLLVSGQSSQPRRHRRITSEQHTGIPVLQEQHSRELVTVESG